MNSRRIEDEPKNIQKYTLDERALTSSDIRSVVVGDFIFELKTEVERRWFLDGANAKQVDHVRIVKNRINFLIFELIQTINRSLLFLDVDTVGSPSYDQQ